MLLQQGKVKDGQEAKELLENQQRNDAKLRKAGSEEWKVKKEQCSLLFEAQQ